MIYVLEVKELIKRGFIEIVKFGRLGREPNVYKFSNRWRREDTRNAL